MKRSHEPLAGSHERGRAPTWWPWALATALVLMVVIVYWPTLENGFVSDDTIYLTGNSGLGSLQGLKNLWFKLGTVEQYYPLVFTTFWFEHWLWGLDPLGYHIVNLALHAVNVLLVWRLLLRLSVPGAWLAAALFAVHPVQLASVAWVSEDKNLLSLGLALGALLAYLRFEPWESATPTLESGVSPRRWLSYVLALVLYITALFAKTVAASVPAVLLVIYWWKRGRLSWRDVAPTLPFFAIGLAMSRITVYMEQKYCLTDTGEFDLSWAERVLIAGRAIWFYARELAWPHPLNFFYHRWSIDTHDWAQYAYPATAVLVVVVLWLARQRLGRGPLAAALLFGGVMVPALGFNNISTFYYSFVSDHYQYHACIALLALAAAAAMAARDRFAPRAAWLAPVACATVLVPLGWVSFERSYVYRDQQTLHEDVVAKDPESWIAHNNLGGVFRDQGQYGPAREHFLRAIEIRQRDLQEHPAWGSYRENLARGYVDLAFMEQRLGHPSEALAAHRKALAERGKLVQERSAVGKYQNDLAASYADVALLERELGQTNEAEADFRQVIALRETLVREQPSIGKYEDDLAGSWVAWGVYARDKERWEEAATAFRKAVELREKLLAHAGQNLVWNIHEKLGGHTREKLAMDDPPVALYRGTLAANYGALATVEEHQGRLAEALDANQKALAIRQRLADEHPTNGRYRLDASASLFDVGRLEGVLGRPAEAERVFRLALEQAERDPAGGDAQHSQDARGTPLEREQQNLTAAVLVDLGNLQRQQGLTAEAETSFRRAIALREVLVREKPDVAAYQAGLAWSYLNLGVLQLSAGRTEEAIIASRRSAEIREGLVRDNPAVIDYRVGLGWSYANLAVALATAGQTVEAERANRKAINLRAMLVQEFPSVDENKHDLALSCRDLGNLLVIMGRPGDGVAMYRTAIEIHRQLMIDYPRNAACRLNLINDLVPAADALGLLGQWADSAAALADAATTGDATWPTLARLALAQLAAGNSPGYHEACAALVARHAATSDPTAEWSLAWTLVAGEQSLVNMQPVVALAQRASQADSKSPSSAVLVAAALYRAEPSAERAAAVARSVEALAQANAPPTEVTAPAWACRLVGEMILARADHDQKERARSDMPLAALRASITEAQKRAPQASAVLPIWSVGAIARVAELEVAKLSDAVEPAATP